MKRFAKYFIVIALIAFVGLFCSCDPEGGSGEVTTESPKWCAMFYLDMANLATDALDCLEEICKAGANAGNIGKVATFFLIGGCAPDCSTTVSKSLYPYLYSALSLRKTSDPFSSAKQVSGYQYWEYTSKGKLKQCTPNDKSISKGTTLTKFIKFCKSTVDERLETEGSCRYLLNLWDHGGGSFLGLISDESSVYWGQSDSSLVMSVADCASAIKASGVTIDVLVLDLCLMQTFEFVNTVGTSVKYIVGSEVSISSEGTAYYSLFEKLYSSPLIETLPLCKYLCDETYTRLSKSYYDDIVLWSVIDTSKLSALRTYYDAFVSNVLMSNGNLTDNAKSKLLSALSSIRNTSAYNSDYWDDSMYDIKVLLTELEKTKYGFYSTSTKKYYTDLENAISGENSPIVYTNLSSDSYCGLSTCIITPEDYNGTYSEYGYKDCAWIDNTWIETYFSNCLTEKFAYFQNALLGTSY